MRYLRWLAVVPGVLGLVFLFFGLLWIGVVQLFVGVGLLALASVLWRMFGGEWPLATRDSERLA